MVLDPADALANGALVRHRARRQLFLVIAVEDGAVLCFGRAGDEVLPADDLEVLLPPRREDEAAGGDNPFDICGALLAPFMRSEPSG